MSETTYPAIEMRSLLRLGASAVLLSDRYRRERAARGLDDTGHFALEVTMVLSAGIALVGFIGWFLLFSGATPLPFVGSHG